MDTYITDREFDEFLEAQRRSFLQMVAWIEKRQKARRERATYTTISATANATAGTEAEVEAMAQRVAMAVAARR